MSHQNLIWLFSNERKNFFILFCVKPKCIEQAREERKGKGQENDWNNDKRDNQKENSSHFSSFFHERIRIRDGVNGG